MRSEIVAEIRACAVGVLLLIVVAGLSWLVPTLLDLDDLTVLSVVQLWFVLALARFGTALVCIESITRKGGTDGHSDKG